MMQLRNVCKAFRQPFDTRTFFSELLAKGFGQQVPAESLSRLLVLRTLDELFHERALLSLLTQQGAVVAGSYALHAYMKSVGQPPGWMPDDLDIFTHVPVEDVAVMVQSVQLLLKHVTGVVFHSSDADGESLYERMANNDDDDDDEDHTYSADGFLEAARRVGQLPVVQDIQNAGWLQDERLGAKKLWRILNVGWLRCRVAGLWSQAPATAQWQLKRASVGALSRTINVIQCQRQLTAQEVFQNFDFTCVKVAVEITSASARYNFILGPHTRHDVLHMKLSPTTQLFPVVRHVASSDDDDDEEVSDPTEIAACVVLARIRKYTRRGFDITSYAS